MLEVLACLVIRAMWYKRTVTSLLEIYQWLSCSRRLMAPFQVCNQMKVVCFVLICVGLAAGAWTEQQLLHPDLLWSGFDFWFFFFFFAVAWKENIDAPPCWFDSGGWAHSCSTHTHTHTIEVSCHMNSLGYSKWDRFLSFCRLQPTLHVANIYSLGLQTDPDDHKCMIFSFFSNDVFYEIL